MIYQLHIKGLGESRKFIQVLVGIQKYARQAVRRRASSPKFQVYNTALMSAQIAKSFAKTTENLEYWGRLVESAVGAYLINAVRGTTIDLHYWRDGKREVDFVLSKEDSLIAIEVISGRSRDALSGMKMFENAFGACKMLLVGDDGVPIEEFLQIPLEDWF